MPAACTGIAAGYRKDEAEAVRSALKKIEAYCLNEFVPKLGTCEYFSVSFEDGGEAHALHVSSPGLVSYDGHPIKEGGRDSLYGSPWRAVPLILHWKEVKEAACAEFRKKEAAMEAVRQFEI